MPLNKLYYVYGLDTACFYDDAENALEKKILKARHLKSLIKKRQKKKETACKTKKYTAQIKFLNEYISKYKEALKVMLSKNVSNTRTVREEKIYDKNGNPSLRRRVSIFDSNLTRCFGLKEREFNTEIVIVKVYFFDVAKSIVTQGFYMNGFKYVFLSSSAGQIRTKKLVAVREDLLKKHWNTLTAGLTIEDINSQGGMNINKFLAYLALCNSATELWSDFDIDRCIVVDDFENTIEGDVDFIDDKTYEITRCNKKLVFTQTDGCGMILPCLTDRNFMVRMPWVKGLLAKFDFARFIRECNGNPIIKDIYGQEHNIIDENIQIILTKSQFKMNKFYNSWQEYKDKFKKYGCTAGKCNIEEDNFPTATINYQMIQTLSDMTDDEIRELAKRNDKDLSNLATDMKTMLRVFGAVPWNAQKNGFQKCLERYPELLSDIYSRETLRDLKKKLERDLWSARFDIGGRYTFVIPDLYAFCEWLFLKEENPVGLLANGEVCCKLYSDGAKLDCLRSPHLYAEHPIRVNNTSFDWFNTKAIYISSHDLISRVVQCDFDGDKLLVCDNPTLVAVAERNMIDKAPLFYDMRKAEAEQLTPDSLFKGLLLAYNGGNIGTPSNDITKIWNSGSITDEQLKVVKWLCAEVNYTIDYSKTLYKPTRPDYADRIITKYTKAKVPYFFKYAKQKETSQVEPVSKCVVDRICGLYPSKNLNFNFKKENIGHFNYKVLMYNSEQEFIPQIAQKFKEVTSNLAFNKESDETMYNYVAVYEEAKRKLYSLGYDPHTVLDVTIIDLFKNRKTPLKKAFWTLFGNDVYDNICRNISNDFVQCEKCHKRFYRKRPNQKYCDKCQGYIRKTTKIIKCCDCGIEMRVPVRSRKIRCDNCKSKERKEHSRLAYEKRKSKNSSKLI